MRKFRRGSSKTSPKMPIRDRAGIKTQVPSCPCASPPPHQKLPLTDETLYRAWNGESRGDSHGDESQSEVQLGVLTDRE